MFCFCNGLIFFSLPRPSLAFLLSPSLLSSQRFKPAASLLILIILTCVFKWYVNRRYFEPSRYMPIVSCPAPTNLFPYSEICQKWKHPALVPPTPLHATATTTTSTQKYEQWQQQQQQQRQAADQRWEDNNETISLDARVGTFAEISLEDQGTPGMPRT